MARQLLAVDLFSGCGGLTSGIRRAGFKVVSAVEIDELAVRTYKLNHDKVKVLCRDIRAVKGKDLLSRPNARIDLVAGCPPCQGFSRVRRKNRNRSANDDRNALIDEFRRLVRSLKPKAVFLENVPGIENYQLFKSFVKALRPEYEVVCKKVDLSDYGVPQRRKRVVLIAGRGFKVAFPEKLDRKRTVRDAIGDVEPPGRSRRRLHNYSVNRAPEVMKRIKAIPKNGGSRESLDKALALRCHKRFRGFRDVYGRMAWKDQAPTITGGCINPSKGRFLHPMQNRAITLFEAALLQTFPRRYRFPIEAGRYPVAAMLGNALPPVFAECIGERFVKLWKSSAMTDVFSQEKRSAIMARIRGKDTTPERTVRSVLHRLGYRFRLHGPGLPGTPDIIFPSRRKVIFVHGCFWHGHLRCKRASLPKTRTAFWRNKIGGNRARDSRTVERLRRLGWRVLQVWQCQIVDRERLIRRLTEFLDG